MGHRVGFVLVAVIAAVAMIGMSGAASEGYTTTVSPRVDVPDRNVTFEGSDYHISHLGRVEPGGTLSVDVDAPAGEDYDVYLYNVDREILDRHRDPGRTTVEFAIPAADPIYHPGTYVVAVDHDGVFQTVTPVVVAGYGVRVTASRSASPGRRVAVGATVTTINDSTPIDRVQAVVGNETYQERVTLARTGDRTFRGAVAHDGLAEGEYTLYVVVQGAKTAFGHQELLGVSDSRPFRVASTPASEATPGTTNTTTPTPHSVSPPNSPRETNTPPPTTANGLITPAHDSPAPTATRTPGQAVGAVPAIVALLVIVVAGRTR